MSEPKLIYNHEDDRYYVYDGEEYVADQNNLADALQYFLALITNSVKREYEDCVFTTFYGKKVTHMWKGDGL